MSDLHIVDSLIKYTSSGNFHWNLGPDKSLRIVVMDNWFMLM